MKETHNDAMTRVYADEGGYSNDAGDSGGPTNYGITIWDARKYWKLNATAADVKAMTKDVAATIYEEHYAHPLAYDQLPAGVDYAVLDYGINSGISRSTKVLQRIVGVPVDGIMGPATLAAVSKKDSKIVINAIMDEREVFLKGLGKPQFIKGWLRRTKDVRKVALSMVDKYGKVISKPTLPADHTTAGGVIVAGGAGVAAYPHYWPYILAGVVVVVITSYLLFKLKGK
jgi:lysozyme family protein